MNTKSKLLVFEKKEVFLIFFLAIILSVVCFGLGVKLGRELTLTQEGFTAADTQVDVSALRLKSQDEENIQKDLAQISTTNNSEISKVQLDHQKLEEEFAKLSAATESSKNAPSISASEMKSREEKVLEDIAADTQKSKKIVIDTPKDLVRSEYVGKYTVQIGAFKTMDEAKKFAQGFKHLGYAPLINEVELPQKGTWYRVSLGAFDTTDLAKDYVKKEQALFQGQDYYIDQIK